MKNYFVAVIFCLVAIFSLYSINALYTGTISVGVGNNISFQVGSGLSFNVTAPCTNGQANCAGTNYYLCVNNVWVNQGNINGFCGYTLPTTTVTSSGGDGGGGNGENSIIALSDFGEETVNDLGKSSPTIPLGNEEPKTTSSTNFFTGAVTGIGNFVKTGEGLVTILFLIIVVVAGIAIITIKKSKLRLKNSETKKKE